MALDVKIPGENVLAARFHKSDHEACLISNTDVNFKQSLKMNTVKYNGLYTAVHKS